MALARSTVFCAIAITSHAMGAVIYVKADAAGSDTGVSWIDAHRNLQTALTRAVVGDQIVIARGVYRPVPPGGARTSTFLVGDGVDLLGGYAGNETDLTVRDGVANPTILSGDINGDDGPNFTNRADNAFHVVCIFGGVNSSLLDSLTIRAGHGDGEGFGASTGSKDQGAGINVFDTQPRIVNCIIEDNYSANHGAFNDHGHSTLIGCTFRRNRADIIGSGLYIHHHSMTTVESCRFEDNFTPADGAGLYCRSMHGGATITNCTFVNNRASNGGGIYCNDDANPIISDCTFTNNIADFGGAGIFSHSAFPTVVSCRFTGGRAGDAAAGTGGGGSGGSGGGGFWATGGAPHVTNCTFTNNSASFGGGCYFIEFSTGTVEHCTFSNNRAGEAGGLYTLQSDIHVDRCLFTDNSADGTQFSVGGGLSNYFSSSIVTRCVFQRNHALLGGGGMYSEGESPVISMCRFDHNTAPASGQSSFQGWGGAVLNGYFTRASYTNCLIAGNQAIRGGGIYNMAFSQPTFINCTIVANSAIGDSEQPARAGAMFTDVGATPRLLNSIAWYNAPNELAGDPATVSYSCVNTGGAPLPGPGNIALQPRFLASSCGPDGIPGTNDDPPRTGDDPIAPLSPSSPCIDAGDTTALAPTGDSASDIDLAGWLRYINDPFTLDTGIAIAPRPIIDMGAYEFQCVADLGSPDDPFQRDFGVTLEDLLIFIDAYMLGGLRADLDDGSSTGTPDGGITLEDLLYFLARYEAGC